ncbi:hypothetical protein [Photorhabdus stackebrandtii]|uniref:Uncharacterized protein n=1 Tax=Photorhabdus stackebrandtii TaxID=1123042 RepID=A0A7X5QMJ7_9GAMM|nr:hypothetical protein [Photorhabdus stackebrandtii]NHB97178.1 hypothetical protein [Photorhabdus stackebrandtii]
MTSATSDLPIAPVAQSLTNNTGCHSTLNENLLPQETHLDALTASISQIEALELNKTLIHLIDREGDSVDHLRQLMQPSSPLPVSLIVI